MAKILIIDLPKSHSGTKSTRMYRSLFMTVSCFLCCNPLQLPTSDPFPISINSQEFTPVHVEESLVHLAPVLTLFKSTWSAEGKRTRSTLHKQQLHPFIPYKCPATTLPRQAALPSNPPVATREPVGIIVHNS